MAYTTVGGFSACGECVGEFETVKKILDGEGDGEEETSGDSEFEGLCDGEKGLETGDKEGKGGEDGWKISLSSLLFVLGELIAFAACCRTCLLNTIPCCWPRCKATTLALEHSTPNHEQGSITTPSSSILFQLDKPFIHNKNIVTINTIMRHNVSSIVR